MTLKPIAFALFLLGLMTAAAPASTFQFGVVYDGTTASLAPGSDTPGGTSLAAGDSFDLTVSAAGNGFFKAIEEFSEFAAATFSVGPSGTRVGNLVTSIYRDGSLVSSRIENNLAQLSTHLGAQTFQVAQGTEFDQVKLSYQLVSATAPTTIAPLSRILGFAPFYDQADRISFTPGSVPPIAEVGLPATALLLASGICLLGLGRRRIRPV